MSFFSFRDDGLRTGSRPRCSVSTGPHARGRGRPGGDRGRRRRMHDVVRALGSAPPGARPERRARTAGDRRACGPPRRWGGRSCARVPGCEAIGSYALPRGRPRGASSPRGEARGPERRRHEGRVAVELVAVAAAPGERAWTSARRSLTGERMLTLERQMSQGRRRPRRFGRPRAVFARGSGATGPERYT